MLDRIPDILYYSNCQKEVIKTKGFIMAASQRTIASYDALVSLLGHGGIWHSKYERYPQGIAELESELVTMHTLIKNGLVELVERIYDEHEETMTCQEFSDWLHGLDAMDMEDGLPWMYAWDEERQLWVHGWSEHVDTIYRVM